MTEDAFLSALAASQKAVLVALGRPRLELAVPDDPRQAWLAAQIQAFCQHVLDDLFDQWEAEVTPEEGTIHENG